MTAGPRSWLRDILAAVAVGIVAENLTASVEFEIEQCGTPNDEHILHLLTTIVYIDDSGYMPRHAATIVICYLGFHMGGVI